MLNRQTTGTKWLAAATMLLATFSAFAAEGESAPESLELPVGFSELLSLGGSLLMVIAAVVVVGWLYAKSQGTRGAASDAISIVASQALGPKERIMLVEIGGKQIVVGMTAQQVQTLHVFDEPVVANHERPAITSPFAERLRTAIRGVTQ